MKLITFHASWLSIVITISASDPLFDSNYAKQDIIVRDVAVIGGGATGTYAAINLRKLNHSVVLVERESTLGGHTNTYTDPATQTTLDYGVQAYWNLSVTRDYFAHFDIPITNWEPEPKTTVYTDFKTGKQVKVRTSSNYSAYIQQLDKYPWLEYSWNQGHPVADDLVLPFRDFVAKYNLVDIAYTAYFSCEGFANVLDQLTINVIKFFDKSYIGALTGDYVTTKQHKNDEIYVRAKAELGQDALTSSTVIASKRSKTGVQLVVKTPSSKKLIRARKLLISMPTRMSDMKPFDVDGKESKVFYQWKYSAYYVMLVRKTGLPAGHKFLNADPSTTRFNIPQLPAPYQITETRVPGLFYVWYSAPKDMTQSEVQADVTTIIKRLQDTVNGATNTSPEFVRFNSHTPFKMVVSADSVINGFYSELFGLQGYRSTWYTGAAMMSHSAGVLWNYTSHLLPEMIAAP